MHLFRPSLDGLHRQGISRLFIVAHSHGGNVAHDALAFTAANVDGLVTLGTPFISASRRHLTAEQQHLLDSAASALTYVTMACVILPLLGLFFWAVFALHTAIDPDATIPLWIAAVGLVGVGLGSVLLITRLDTAMRANKALYRLRTAREDWCAFLTGRRSDVPCFALRASGDQAHAWLVAVQLLHTAQTLISRAVSLVTSHYLTRHIRELFEQERWLVVAWCISLVVLAGLSKEATAEEHSALPFILVALAVVPFALFAAATLLELLVVVVLLALAGLALLLPSVFFGYEFVLLAPWVDVQVETVPTDRVVEAMSFSKNFASDAQLSNRHSVYALDSVVGAIGDWVQRHWSSRTARPAD